MEEKEIAGSKITTIHSVTLSKLKTTTYANKPFIIAYLMLVYTFPSASPLWSDRKQISYHVVLIWNRIPSMHFVLRITCLVLIIELSYRPNSILHGVYRGLGNASITSIHISSLGYSMVEIFIYWHAAHCYEVTSHKYVSFHMSFHMSFLILQYVLVSRAHKGLIYAWSSSSRILDIPSRGSSGWNK